MKDLVKKTIFSLFERLPEFSDANRQFKLTDVRNILVCPGGGGIGDLLLAFPAISALKSNFKDASISLFVSSESAELLSLFPEETISELIYYYVKRERHAFSHKIALIRYLRKKRFELSVFLSRGESMRDEALISSLVGASYRLGFSRNRVGLHNTVKLGFKDDVPIVRQTLALLKAAQIDTGEASVRLKIPEDDMEAARNLIIGQMPSGHTPLISVHMGASWSSEHKCWPLGSYISLIKAIIKKFQARVILIGSKSEIESGRQAYLEIGESSLINMIGKTTISLMAAFIDLSDLFIGNDSGPLHLSLALGRPSVAIFGPTSPLQIISSSGSCTILSGKTPCAPCYLHQPGFRPTCNDAICLKGITVEDVLAALEKRLAEQKQRAAI